MDFDFFNEFIKQSDREEILKARLIKRDNSLIAMFVINRSINDENTDVYKNERILHKKYKSLVSLFLLNQSFDDNLKIQIHIKPDIVKSNS